MACVSTDAGRAVFKRLPTLCTPGRRQHANTHATSTLGRYSSKVQYTEKLDGGVTGRRLARARHVRTCFARPSSSVPSQSRFRSRLT